MELRSLRIYNNERYCISKLYINGGYYCDVIEDTDRLLDSNMTLEEIKSIKVSNKTAIPTGEYNINMEIFSNKFGIKDFYRRVCNGKVPRLENVKGYDGILIHCGNDETDTSGCLLVGWNIEKGKVRNSKIAFENLYHKMSAAYDNGEKIKIIIERNY